MQSHSVDRAVLSLKALRQGPSSLLPASGLGPPNPVRCHCKLVTSVKTLFPNQSYLEVLSEGEFQGTLSSPVHEALA